MIKVNFKVLNLIIWKPALNVVVNFLKEEKMYIINFVKFQKVIEMKLQIIIKNKKKNLKIY
jgi:hypothetical protein